MTSDNTPTNGDFTADLEQRNKTSQTAAATPDPEQAPANQAQTINDILERGEEPTDEFLEGMVALDTAPPLTDEELAQQALAHPGADGDAATPE
jgi:hypothetical protein